MASSVYDIIPSKFTKDPNELMPVSKISALLNAGNNNTQPKMDEMYGTGGQFISTKILKLKNTKRW